MSYYTTADLAAHLRDDAECAGCPKCEAAASRLNAQGRVVSAARSLLVGYSYLTDTERGHALMAALAGCGGAPAQSFDAPMKPAMSTRPTPDEANENDSDKHLPTEPEGDEWVGDEISREER